MIAHVAGAPIEEALLSLAGAGGGLLMVRAWIMVRLRRLREPGT